MQITYLGHAGFCVETAQTILVIDPWLSERGAFDAAWFQYPKNHHLHAVVHNLLNNSTKDKYLYISHEHQDHFDLDFLISLLPYQLTVILANFDHPVVKNSLLQHHFSSQAIVVLNDQEAYLTPDTVITLFLVDSEMNCDSAILIQSQNGVFLNLNDCKIHDRLPLIIEKYGKIDVFTAQFSGASWYPTCYSMSTKEYATACKTKIAAKFNAVAQAINTIRPKLFLPSAGPPCFLDPKLIAINFQAINTYPQAAALLAYLDQHLAALRESIRWEMVTPGDRLDVPDLTWTRYPTPAILEHEFAAYVRSYAAEKKPLFIERAKAHKKIKPHRVFQQLKSALTDKLAQLKCVEHSAPPLLYWQIEEYSEQMYCLDLQHKTLDLVSTIRDPNHYCRITAPAWQVAKVLNNELTWPEFALTLRVKIERVPDVYDTLLHGFLILGPDKIASFCEKLAAVYQNQARINVEYAGKQYSILRYCPHQGGDLSLGHMEGSCIVCPLHQWKFDLLKQGACTQNHTTIAAVVCQLPPEN